MRREADETLQVEGAILTTSRNVSDAAQVAADDCPADRKVDSVNGATLPITDTTGFVRYFKLTFRVKINSFVNRTMHQILMSTDDKAFEIKGLGSSKSPYEDRLEAYVVTDATLGPSGHGITGNGIAGSLVSQKITTGDWHDVELVKTRTHLSFTVDGTTVTEPTSIDLLVSPNLFDLKAGSTEVVAGEAAGSGDIGLDGDLCDVTLDLVEPPAPSPPAGVSDDSVNGSSSG